MYASVGFGAISAGKIVARLLEEYRKRTSRRKFRRKVRRAV